MLRRISLEKLKTMVSRFRVLDVSGSLCLKVLESLRSDLDYSIAPDPKDLLRTYRIKIQISRERGVKIHGLDCFFRSEPELEKGFSMIHGVRSEQYSCYVFADKKVTKVLAVLVLELQK